jgi:hypothetical protein
MSYALSWLGDEQILYCRLWGTLQVPELRAANMDMDSLLVASKSPIVHLVFHMTDIDERLPSLSALRGPLTTRSRDRVGLTVFVEGSAAVRFIGAVVVSALGLRVHSSPTVEDAILSLARAAPDLEAVTLNALQRLALLAPGQLPAESVFPNARRST